MLKFNFDVQKGKSYFDALASYGLNKIVEMYTQSNQKYKIVSFLKTHLRKIVLGVICDNFFSFELMISTNLDISNIES